jgi:hypothetical protein
MSVNGFSDRHLWAEAVNNTEHHLQWMNLQCSLYVRAVKSQSKKKRIFLMTQSISDISFSGRDSAGSRSYQTLSFFEKREATR